jgi:hypothetical protein
MSKKLKTCYNSYHKFIEDNQMIKFPKKFINTKKIQPVIYKICVIKPTEENDIFRKVRDDYGRITIEPTLGDWTILASENYNIEEEFYIFDNALNYKTNIDSIIKLVTLGIYKYKSVKQIIIVHNKLLIYNEEQFNMIICKNKKDAQRLHHTLAKILKKQKIKNVLFMGTATPATISIMYDVIKENTGWPIKKIRRTSTRP